MNAVNAEGVRAELVSEISSSLDSVGLMYRIFSRSKTKASLNRKIESNSDYGKNKKLQDLVGIRVVLYFNDDISSVRSIVSSLYSEKSNDVSIDQVGNEEFRAVRYNIVYSLSDELSRILNLGDSSDVIDATFELQIRTIFSEGWHEIEHDLRYKCKDDWVGFDGESRLLNGVYASLESSEWTMIKIFDELAYQHYKAQQWSSMMRQKLRLRFIDDRLVGELKSILDNDNALAKKFFRVDREFLVSEMSKRGFYYPLTLSNIIYFINILAVKDSRIFDLTPDMMLNDMVID
ncbi:MAG: hypothetical protein ACPHZA_02345 [Marinobacter adhaerens]|uniref:hypothetical protein n=1 Tax=Marinobacter adhaerens TaxID=1033846 RepID=UPI003C40092E